MYLLEAISNLFEMSITEWVRAFGEMSLIQALDIPFTALFVFFGFLILRRRRQISVWAKLSIVIAIFILLSEIAIDIYSSHLRAIEATYSADWVGTISLLSLISVMYVFVLRFKWHSYIYGRHTEKVSNKEESYEDKLDRLKEEQK